MNSIEWIAAASDLSADPNTLSPQGAEVSAEESELGGLTSEAVPQPDAGEPTPESDENGESQYQESWEQERVRRIYRGRTVGMLRRYMRYSIETGRLPSLLGREFFRAKVTSYTVVTFEDRVIFVHDMERCLEKL
ncbi:MAG TPA: hypothetical protein VJQ54_03195, partial [Candidatus Sulfotelmatobacter sp.]|nr:hypothetical protein [Candidatus Sulfotelmatobacter sp.]